MSIVSFWGTVHGQASTTSNVIAAASILALEYNLKTMITQTQWSHSTLESSFIKANRKDGLLTFSDTGIDALERLARSNRLTAEKVSDYTVSVLKERLDLLVGSSKPSISMFEDIGDVLDIIFSVAKEYYDLCLIDVHSGTQNEVTKKVLNESDLIVVNLNQNIHVLERFFNREDYLDVLDEKPYVIVLSQYDHKSQYTVKNIKRRFKCTQPIFTVPYNTNYRDASNNQAVIEYFLRARNFTKNNLNYFFMEELRKLAEGIIKLSNKNSSNASTEGVS